MNQPKLLLCTDLDRTLLPNGTQPESPQARRYFTRLTERPDITLVYVTGRHKLLVQQAIKCYCLPQPDMVISDVGTKIYDLRTGDWTTWRDWEKEITPDWAGQTHADLCELFHDLTPLNLQEREKQNTHKVSYYVSLYEDKDKLIQKMDERLTQRGINASLIWSIDEPTAVGLLDVLPRGATKLHAIEFLRERLDYALNETVFAGDSGNDLPVLTSRLPAVLVLNAAETVREAARAGAERSANLDAIYFAKGGFLGMNGNYSAGILEGVAHYRPEVRSWLQESEGAEYAD
ncbi:MAG: HAD-IIB family hydrolase [Pseudomonadota bacterium]|nr:HAD-IIB family hydrolase [Pseudomonadota bacterium]